ncbi:MAG TPA: hypothetical protein VKT52_11720 [Ktedonobacterales bacterium]|nr:hypothetical protein [Ktedonobacterales bacterium]
MSDKSDTSDNAGSGTSDHDSFVVSPEPENSNEGGATLDGGTVMGPVERRRMLQRQVANPDDPIVRRPRYGKYGPEVGPDYRGALGRVAIVQGQIFIVGAIVVIQLFLITTALFELLSGQTNLLWWICAACFVSFLVALLVALWPRSRVKGF